jgi:hypothetical protein
VVIRPLMAIGNLLIRATLKRENEQQLTVMGTIYGTLIRLRNSSKKEDEVIFFCGGFRNLYKSPRLIRHNI